MANVGRKDLKKDIERLARGAKKNQKELDDILVKIKRFKKQSSPARESNTPRRKRLILLFSMAMKGVLQWA